MILPRSLAKYGPIGAAHDAFERFKGKPVFLPACPGRKGRLSTVVGMADFSREGKAFAILSVRRRLWVARDDAEPTGPRPGCAG